MWQDLRYTWRTLRRSPVVTVIAVLTLVFGIGLNTSMFAFMNALMFRPLPFQEPAKLVSPPKVFLVARPGSVQNRTVVLTMPKAADPREGCDAEPDCSGRDARACALRDDARRQG